jgi:molybdenum cofactor cytidylyltransferase
MKFEAVRIENAEGHILGHNIAGVNGRRLLRKGKVITADHIAILQELGRHTVYVAQIASDDIDENVAARRLSSKAAGEGIRLSNAATGRVNLFADCLGVLRIDVKRLLAMNRFAGVTLATMVENTAVSAGKTVATLKIIPYALPEVVVRQAEKVATTAFINIVPLLPKKAGLILSGAAEVQERVVPSFRNALSIRLGQLNATIEQVDYVPLEDETDEEQLANAIQAQIGAGLEIIILAGETAIMDRYDIAPRAIACAGGEVTCFGAPVDPGNLLMLGYHGAVPIVGAPGCVRSPKTNIIDLILPRVLVGERLAQADIMWLAHGGLLEDVPERPLPRSHLT